MLTFADLWTPDTTPMGRAAALWMRLYRGQAPWLDDDSLTSMNLPAFVAAEVARLATVEMQSTINPTGGLSSRAAYLTTQYQPVLQSARTFTEYAAAGGSLILKPYVDGRSIRVDAIQSGQFRPTNFDQSGRITACTFASRAVQAGETFLRLEHHTLHPAGCRITNEAYSLGPSGQSPRRVSLTAVPAWASLAPDAFIDGIDRPLFALLTMPGANPIDPASPLGVSAYARAVDLIREADKQFSRLLWEMESGERALYVDMRAFAPDETDPGLLPFKRFYRTMDADPGATTLFEAWSPPLREQSHLNALNEILQRVEDACALARGTLSEAPESSARGARTATELKIMRQRTYAAVHDTQRNLTAALRDLVWAMDTYATLYSLAPTGGYDLTFALDDSVIAPE